MPEVRLQLSRALGIGTGSCQGTGVASRSWRGRIVRLTDDLAGEIDSRFGVIVTDPGYSTRRRYQTFVPLLNEEEYERDELDVAVEDGVLGKLEPGLKSALLSARLVQTAFHPLEIHSWTGLEVTDSVMEALDRQFQALFGL